MIFSEPLPVVAFFSLVVFWDFFCPLFSTLNVHSDLGRSTSARRTRPLSSLLLEWPMAFFQDRPISRLSPLKGPSSLAQYSLLDEIWIIWFFRKNWNSNYVTIIKSQNFDLDFISVPEFEDFKLSKSTIVSTATLSKYFLDDDHLSWRITTEFCCKTTYISSATNTCSSCCNKKWCENTVYCEKYLKLHF